MDSGATQHFTSDATALEAYRMANPGTKVLMADGSFLEAKGRGRP